MYKEGDKIGFVGEKKPYTIQACDERYLICTKPFNLRHTVFYTIVDLVEGIRGADNYWAWGGRFEYKDKEECKMALKALNDGYVDEWGETITIEISTRNRCTLKIW